MLGSLGQILRSLRRTGQGTESLGASKNYGRFEGIGGLVGALRQCLDPLMWPGRGQISVEAGLRLFGATWVISGGSLGALESEMFCWPKSMVSKHLGEYGLHRRRTFKGLETGS